MENQDRTRFSWALKYWLRCRRTMKEIMINTPPPKKRLNLFCGFPVSNAKQSSVYGILLTYGDSFNNKPKCGKISRKFFSSFSFSSCWEMKLIFFHLFPPLNSCLGSLNKTWTRTRDMLTWNGKMNTTCTNPIQIIIRHHGILRTGETAFPREESHTQFVSQQERDTSEIIHK